MAATSALVALAIVGNFLPGIAQEAPETGIIVGRVSLPTAPSDGDFVEAILMSPEWATIWNGEVQQRTDAYFANNIAAIDRDRDLFALISRRARQESTTSVIAQMRQRMGESFTDVVQEVQADGNFEFVDVPFGTYRIIVVAGIGEGRLVWSSRPVSVRSPIPEFVEIEDRIQ